MKVSTRAKRTITNHKRHDDLCYNVTCNAKYFHFIHENSITNWSNDRRKSIHSMKFIKINASSSS